MKVVEGREGTNSIRIIPESDFEKHWLMKFIGGAGVPNDWEFLEKGNRKAEFRVEPDGEMCAVDAIEIAVHRIK